MDFYCADVRLCVEVDGRQHDLDTEHDRVRDSVLLAKGIRTMRVSTADCFYSAPAVAKMIQQECERLSKREH
jgi:very-short-patch-repair endonuclease